MPVSCHFQGCKALLRTVKRRYISSTMPLIICCLFAMQLILVPVLVPYGIYLQNPYPTDADFSRLRHIPKFLFPLQCRVSWRRAQSDACGRGRCAVAVSQRSCASGSAAGITVPIGRPATRPATGRPSEWSQAAVADF